MNLSNSLHWMFWGSLVIGTFLNGMNILAYRLSDLYLSKTLVYSALLMASNMCILEILMFYDHTRMIKLNLLLIFVVLSLFILSNPIRKMTFGHFLARIRKDKS